MSRWILLRLRNVSHKTCTDNQNTHFMFSNFFPLIFKCWEWEDGESWWQIGKIGRTLFDRPKPTVGCSANGRRRRTFSPEYRAVYEIMWKNTVQPDRLHMAIWRKLIAGYLRLQTQTQTMQYLLFFHCDSGCTNAPLCYVIRTVRCLACFVLSF